MQVKDTNRSRRDLALLAVACLVLQVAFVPNVPLGNGRANAALVFSGVVSLLVGGQVGVFCGFLAGLVFDLSTTGPIGLMAFLLTIGSFVVGIEARNRFADDLRGSLSAFATLDLAVTLLYHVAMFLVGQANGLVDVVFLRTLPTFVLTMLLFAPFAWFISHTTSTALTLGGKPSKSARLRGSHYDLGNL